MNIHGVGANLLSQGMKVLFSPLRVRKSSIRRIIKCCIRSETDVERKTNILSLKILILKICFNTEINVCCVRFVDCSIVGAKHSRDGRGGGCVR